MAGHKIGNLFSCRFSSEKELNRKIIENNNLLNEKGVRIQVLKISGDWALIYVYREKGLKKTLGTPKVQDFLRSCGYESMELSDCIEVLKSHLREEEFPHEIGAFLNYPIEDIVAFIQNQGKNYKCVGDWKVYENEEEAKRTFDLYDKCKKIYCQKLLEGLDITRLTVGG